MEFVALVDRRTKVVSYLNRTGKIYPKDFVLRCLQVGCELTERTTIGIVAVGCFVVGVLVVGCCDGGGC